MNSLDFDQPWTIGFKHYECNHPAFEQLVMAATTDYMRLKSQGVSQDKRDRRLVSTRLLLGALVAAGRDGPSVGIARIENPTPLMTYPKGHGTALKMLEDAKWVYIAVKRNRWGSYSTFAEGGGEIAFAKEAKAAPNYFKLTDKAWKILEEGGFRDSDARPSRDRLIVMTAPIEGKDDELRIPPPEYPLLEDWRNQVADYNDFIAGFDFRIEDQVLACPFLYRVFNRGEYSEGGRFYSSFANLASLERMQLRINDQKVISLDYKNLHGRLSLACAGLPCPSDADLYQRGRLAAHDRGRVKQVWNTALNASGNGGLSSNKAVNFARVEGHDLRQILADIKQEYPGIACVMGRGVGLKLQRADAEAVSVLIDGFMAQGKPIVPVHDGFYFLNDDKHLFNSLLSEAQAAIYGQLIEHWPDLPEHLLPMDT
jgi:hypothetical protein